MLGKRRVFRGFAAIASMCVLCLLLLGAEMSSTHLQSIAKWFIQSREYKAKVMAQPAQPDGELRHVEWQSWGWGGNDTIVYLVFDPDDTLAAVAKSGLSGKYPGIPCAVSRVRRQESEWYTVEFYTDSDWGYCY